MTDEQELRLWRVMWFHRHPEARHGGRKCWHATTNVEAVKLGQENNMLVAEIGCSHRHHKGAIVVELLPEGEVFLVTGALRGYTVPNRP